MRAHVIGLALLSATLSVTAAEAYDAYNPANCNGIGWRDPQVLVVSKVTAAPRVNFV